jgi:hypothetical protein
VGTNIDIPEPNNFKECVIMYGWDRSPLNSQEKKIYSRLNLFVKEHQQQIAAINWGLLQEWGDTKDTLGIDLKPTPHFVACSRSAIEKLNNNVNSYIQEILGLLDNYQPEIEVYIIAIGEGQIYLISFQPQPTPPECFSQNLTDLDREIATLEEKIKKYIN